MPNGFMGVGDFIENEAKIFRVDVISAGNANHIQVHIFNKREATMKLPQVLDMAGSADYQ
jgi:hypothetical protein